MSDLEFACTTETEKEFIVVKKLEDKILEQTAAISVLQNTIDDNDK